MTTNLNDLERSIKARYIDGGMSRSVYQSELASVHAAKAHAAKLGPCTCGACVEDRASA